RGPLVGRQGIEVIECAGRAEVEDDWIDRVGGAFGQQRQVDVERYVHGGAEDVAVVKADPLAVGDDSFRDEQVERREHQRQLRLVHVERLDFGILRGELLEGGDEGGREVRIGEQVLHVEGRGEDGGHYLAV